VKRYNPELLIDAVIDEDIKKYTKQTKKTVRLIQA